MLRAYPAGQEAGDLRPRPRDMLEAGSDIEVIGEAGAAESAFAKLGMERRNQAAAYAAKVFNARRDTQPGR